MSLVQPVMPQALRPNRNFRAIALMSLMLSMGALSSCTTEVLSPTGVPIKTPTTHPSPPKVDPITVGRKQYGGGYNQGALPIVDADTGKKIKIVTIYSYPENGSPAIFIKSMKLVNNGQDILIENELGDKFYFNLKTEKVKPAKGNKWKAPVQ